MATTTEKTNSKNRETSPLVAQVTADIRKGIRLLSVLDEIPQEELAGRILAEYVTANPVQVVRG